MSMSTSASVPPSTLGGSGFGRGAAGPIGNGDLVEMSVFDTPELSGKLRVSNTGEVVLPLGGRFQVAGMKAEEAASLIHREYSYQTEPVHVQNEPAENAFSPADEYRETIRRRRRTGLSMPGITSE